MDDLTYEERLDDILDKLEKIYNNELIKYMFIITAEEIKETALEIDYIIEEIVNNTEEYLDDLSKTLFKTLGKKEKEVLIFTLKCIKQQENNGNINNYINELIDIEEENPTIYKNVYDSFEAIKKKLSQTKDNEKKEVLEKFNQLKNTLNGICFDLFEFVDNCKRGIISLRKIKAIAPIKVEIIKTLLDIEYFFKKDNKVKSAIDVLKNIKIKNKK